MDEIHITFDSTDYKDFPAEMLSVLSFCRKYSMQFLCSAQIYERIPKKIRDIANFTVVCKNIGHLDRLFRDYYYEKNSYEKDIAGALSTENGKGIFKKKRKCTVILKIFAQTMQCTPCMIQRNRLTVWLRMPRVKKMLSWRLLTFCLTRAPRRSEIVL